MGMWRNCRAGHVRGALALRFTVRQPIFNHPEIPDSSVKGGRHESRPTRSRTGAVRMRRSRRHQPDVRVLRQNNLHAHRQSGGRDGALLAAYWRRRIADTAAEVARGSMGGQNITASRLRRFGQYSGAAGSQCGQRNETPIWKGSGDAQFGKPTHRGERSVSRIRNPPKLRSIERGGWGHD